MSKEIIKLLLKILLAFSLNKSQRAPITNVYVILMLDCSAAKNKPKITLELLFILI